MSSKDMVGNIFWKGNDFLIASHLNPDGDAIGSLLGLGLALKNLSKNVTLVSLHPVPHLYQFLPGSESIQTLENLKRLHYEFAVVLDCTEPERTGEEVAAILQNSKTVINIDHHLGNKSFGNFNIIDTGAAATGELVFEILDTMGVQITPEIATSLYAAIVTDTGSFQHQNTTVRCHQNAAALLQYGAAHERVYRSLYEERSPANLFLLERCLRTLKVSDDGLIAWMIVTQKCLIETGSRIEDCEDLVNYPKSLKGVEVGILFKEINSQEIKVSLRSKNIIDVNQVAACFGGGGHQRAAGCTIQGHLKDVVKEILEKTALFFPATGEE